MNLCIGYLFRNPSITFVAISMQRLPAGVFLRLLQCILQRVPVERIAVKSINGQNPVVFGTADHGDFAAKFILLVDFPLGNALHFRGMNTVNLILVVSFLMEDGSGNVQDFG